MSKVKNQGKFKKFLSWCMLASSLILSGCGETYYRNRFDIADSGPCKGNIVISARHDGGIKSVVKDLKTDVYVISPDGSDIMDIGSANLAMPSWSEDGRGIYGIVSSVSNQEHRMGFELTSLAGEDTPVFILAPVYREDFFMDYVLGSDFLLNDRSLVYLDSDGNIRISGLVASDGEIKREGEKIIEFGETSGMGKFLRLGDKIYYASAPRNSLVTLNADINKGVKQNGTVSDNGFLPRIFEDGKTAASMLLPRELIDLFLEDIDFYVDIEKYFRLERQFKETFGGRNNARAEAKKFISGLLNQVDIVIKSGEEEFRYGLAERAELMPSVSQNGRYVAFMGLALPGGSLDVDEVRVYLFDREKNKETEIQSPAKTNLLPSVNNEGEVIFTACYVGADDIINDIINLGFRNRVEVFLYDKEGKLSMIGPINTAGFLPVFDRNGNIVFSVLDVVNGKRVDLAYEGESKEKESRPLDAPIGSHFYVYDRITKEVRRLELDIIKRNIGYDRMKMVFGEDIFESHLDYSPHLNLLPSFGEDGFVAYTSVDIERLMELLKKDVKDMPGSELAKHIAQISSIRMYTKNGNKIYFPDFTVNMPHGYRTGYNGGLHFPGFFAKLSSDGRHLAYLAFDRLIVDNHAGVFDYIYADTQVWLRDLGTGKSTMLTNSPGTKFNLAWKGNNDITFNAWEPQSGIYRLEDMAVPVTRFVPTSQVDLDVNSDESFLYFNSRDDRNPGVFSLDTNGNIKKVMESAPFAYNGDKLFNIVMSDGVYSLNLTDPEMPDDSRTFMYWKGDPPEILGLAPGDEWAYVLDSRRIVAINTQGKGFVNISQKIAEYNQRQRSGRK